VKGPWVWSDTTQRRAVLHAIKKSHLDQILSALAKNQGKGLSNAELDSVLGASSQWIIHWKLTELLALGLIEYTVEPFGEPGRYTITPLGVTVLPEVS
jgi:DNA-binding HxlR family transcriptional regulator